MSVSFFYSIIFSSWDQIPEAEQSPGAWSWLMAEAEACSGEGVVAVTSYCRSLCSQAPIQRELGRKWVYSGFI